MTQDIKINKNIQIRSFHFKWYEYLIVYGLININFFVSINSIINNIYENFSKLFVSDVTFDGSDFSGLFNMFAAPIFLFMVLINIGFNLILEFIYILIFKFVYFLSVVKEEEKPKLYQSIRISLLCFMVVNILGTVFWVDIRRIILFFFLYIPVPLFTNMLVCSKLRRSMKVGITGYGSGE